MKMRKILLFALVFTSCLSQAATFSELRNRFEAAYKPSLASLQLSKPWICTGIKNDKNNSVSSIATLVYSDYEGKIISLNTQGHIFNYTSNNQGYIGFLPSQNREQESVNVVKVEADGNPIIEISLTYSNLGLARPIYIPYIKPIGTTNDEVTQLLRSGRHVMTISYASCKLQ